MKNSISIFRLTLATAGLLLLAGKVNIVLAQGPGSTGPTPSPPPTGVPLDGGASLLLAAGAAYGLRRLRKTQRG